MSVSQFKQIFIGFKSPIHSVRFFVQNKGMMLIGIGPHIINFILYLWVVRHIVIAKWVLPLFHSLALKWEGSFIAPLFNPTFIEIIIWVIGILFYGIFGTAFVNAVASPLYDIIAQKAYEATSGKQAPKQTFMDFIDSIISEVTKAVIIICVFIVSFFVHIFAPFIIILGIWYLGWINIDRTLLLMNLRLKQRILYGIKNWGLCIGLGVWSYIPIFGTLFAFSMAAAGAIVVAKHETEEHELLMREE